MTDRVDVLGMSVSVLSMSTFLSCIQHLVTGVREAGRGAYVCVSNVHMCMEVHDDECFAAVVNKADLVVADGKPISLAQHLLGYPDAQQIRGMDLTLALCEHGARNRLRVGFYGGAPDVLVAMQTNLRHRYPGLDIVYSFSPPFRPLSPDEDVLIVQAINDACPDLLFVGLGCPRQEFWMHAHHDSIRAVMLGVGAAFDFIAGNKKAAPRWMQVMSLEWLHRLFSEPKRLWWRYLYHNPRFLWLLTVRLLVGSGRS